MCRVEFVQGRNEGVNDARQQEIELLLKDMGKWESLTKFLGDSGLKDQGPTSYKSGYELYDITPQLMPQTFRSVLLLTFRIKEEEAHLRTNRNDMVSEISIREITEQLENINKWKNFEKLLQTIKVVKQPTTFEPKTSEQSEDPGKAPALFVGGKKERPDEPFS